MRWVLSAIALVGSVAAQAAAPASPPVAEWDELSRVVGEIEKAATVDAAATAYARGCSINRQSARLQNAYVRQMLKLGRADIAASSAQLLTQLDGRNGLAWGVVAYADAKKNLLARALPPGLKAAELEKDNPSIVQNAAQLLVWYENASPPPTMPPDVKDTIKVLKTPAAGKAFAEAYKAAKDEWAKSSGQDAKLLQKKTADAEADAKKADQALQKHLDTIRQKGRNYETETRRLQDLLRQLSRAEDDLQRTTIYQSRQSAERRCEDLRRQIRDKERDIRRLEDEGRKLQDEKKDLVKAAESKRSEVETLKAKGKALSGGVPASFQWQVPAVDGVIPTDASASAGKVAAAPAATAPAAAPSSAPAPTPSLAPLGDRLAEAEAADKLSLAKLHISSKLDSSAKKLLQEIVAAWPNTAAAKEAAELLKTLP